MVNIFNANLPLMAYIPVIPSSSGVDAIKIEGSVPLFVGQRKNSVFHSNIASMNGVDTLFGQ
jgi:hypothetical protein